HLQSHAVCHNVPQVHQVWPFQGQPTSSTTVNTPHQPASRPRVRARRGQATDPHSIAERGYRCNSKDVIACGIDMLFLSCQSDRATMLDEILDYVKFLRLQVKVLSMSRLGGASTVSELVADIPLQSVEVVNIITLLLLTNWTSPNASIVSDNATVRLLHLLQGFIVSSIFLGDSCECHSNQQVWEKWSDAETEQEVTKLMKEDVGAAMQYLQSRSLCIMPVSLAAFIYPTHQIDDQ
ncbi:hypothetical protein BC332_10697, partial [Capsicum chinense]